MASIRRRCRFAASSPHCRHAHDADGTFLIAVIVQRRTFSVASGPLTLGACRVFWGMGFGRRLAAHTADFQTEKGYDKAAPGKANLSMSTNQLAERFGAVSVTLEMPFKDHDPNPDATFGWSGERSAQLGVSCLEVLTEMIGTL